MIDTSKGMIWYRVFQCLLVLWIITTFTPIGELTSLLEEQGIAFDAFLSFRPLYCCSLLIFVVARIVTCVLLFNAMRRYDYAMLKYLDILTVTFVVVNLLPSIALMVDAGLSAIESELFVSVGSCVSLCVILLLTRRYLKKRFMLPVNDVDEPRSIRFCRYCGNELRGESKFCDGCGKKVRK